MAIRAIVASALSVIPAATNPAISLNSLGAIKLSPVTDNVLSMAMNKRARYLTASLAIRHNIFIANVDCKGKIKKSPLCGISALFY